jgi:hypothetical protein
MSEWSLRRFSAKASENCAKNGRLRRLRYILRSDDDRRCLGSHAIKTEALNRFLLRGLCEMKPTTWKCPSPSAFYQPQFPQNSF